MATSSAATCKLNSKFVELTNGERFYRGKMTIRNAWGGHQADVLKDRKHKGANGIEFKVPGMNCCGLEELNFTTLQQPFRNTYKDDAEGFIGLVANYIKECFQERDNRVVICGLPIKVGTHSMYDAEFYAALREALKELGFIEVGKPYKNINSGNTIVALVGQLTK